LKVRQSRAIFEALEKIRARADWDALPPAWQRVIELRLRSARLAGIALPEEQRRQFNANEQELSRLSTEFSNHVLDATKSYGLNLTDPADVEGIPPTVLALAAQAHRQWLATTQADEAARKNEANGASAPAGSATAASQPPPAAHDSEASPSGDSDATRGPWRFTLEAALVVPFLQHCRRRELREQVYRAYVTRASAPPHDNTPLIPEILRRRREKARLLGFRTYAEVSVESKMVPSVERVFEFLEELRSASWQPAHTEFDELTDIARRHDAELPLKHWDVAFWSERLREERFEFTDEQLRPYFPLDRVLDGLFALVEDLFGIRVRPAECAVSTWDPDVRFFHVLEDDRIIAAFYLDPYSRPRNKRPGAWMDECLVRRRCGDRRQLPVAYLVCNSTPPVGSTPSLMTFREVETLFHEFGHGLQHMLTVVDEADVSGINGVEWDAVELASQFMENWCYHRPTMDRISGHYQTGEPLPDDLFRKLCEARTFRAASAMLRQLFFGLVDMELHHRFDPQSGTDPFDVQRSVAERTSVLPPLPEDRTLCSFQHIFAGGYAAGYFSYKWAEVLSADAFEAFQETGLDDPAALRSTGRRFRETVLALGGSRHPAEVYRAFRGRDADPKALLRLYGLLPGTDTD
ncbi:MAG: M3 family peptidase, partial [Planctomycetota bacterium]